MTDLRRLTIERLVAGGDGLARVPGEPVTFVPGAAPGDVVLAEISAAGKGLRRGRIAEVLAPGPGRRKPPCPEASLCGGCPWMHLTEEAQASAADDILASALQRAHVPLADGALRPAAVPEGLRYRQRMRLHLDLRGAPVAGFLRARSHDVHGIGSTGSTGECLALSPELEQVRRAIEPCLPALREALGAVRAELAVDLPSPAGAAAALLRLDQPAARDALQRALEILRDAAPRLTALAAEAPGGGGRARIGEDVVAFRRGPVEDPERWPAFLAPGGFLQASRAGNALLVSGVLAAARAAGLGPGSRVLELFAGSGNLSLPLAGLGARVDASDSDETATRLAERAAAACDPPLAAPPRFAALDAAIHARRQIAAGRHFDAVVLDPPRTGARDVAPLLHLLAPRVIWVSCDAPTFARDAAIAAESGFVIRSVEPLLLFPQTAHFETVALLEKPVIATRS